MLNHDDRLLLQTVSQRTNVSSTTFTEVPSVRQSLSPVEHRTFQFNTIPSQQSVRNSLNIRPHIQYEGAQFVAFLASLVVDLCVVLIPRITPDQDGNLFAAPTRCRAIRGGAFESAHDMTWVLSVSTAPLVSLWFALAKSGGYVDSIRDFAHDLWMKVLVHKELSCLDPVFFGNR